MPNPPPFGTTVVGSFPHASSQGLCRRLIDALDLPAWPQFPRRAFQENMYAQFSAPLPGLVLDSQAEKIYFQISGDLSSLLTPFYERVLAGQIDAFALPVEYAEGFHAMLDALSGTPGEWAKGQVTGPVSFGLTVTDENLRASLYDEMLADAIVKNLAMNARWQARTLRQRRPGVVIFVDEPYMASFGSAYISLAREQVIAMLDEVFEAIHAEGALAGVHCCANTDWSVLLATKIDILNLDAYGYLENLALYPDELAAFLARGGIIAWGIVPNDQQVFETDAAALAERLRDGIEHIRERAASRGVSLPDDLAVQSLITPSCGLGSATVEIAERCLELLRDTAQSLREGA